MSRPLCHAPTTPTNPSTRTLRDEAAQRRLYQTLALINPPVMHAHQMLRVALVTTIGVAFGVSGSFAIAASSSSVSAADTRVIFKAVGLTERAGKLFDACGEIVQPELEAVDLNSDGRPEVFVTVPGSCQGGAAGAELSLLIKSSKGQWKVNLGFPAGGYKLLTTRNMGFPDIEIGGPGFCFPVWRWNGSQYAIYKRCDR